MTFFLGLRLNIPCCKINPQSHFIDIIQCKFGGDGFPVLTNTQYPLAFEVDLIGKIRDKKGFFFSQQCRGWLHKNEGLVRFFVSEFFNMCQIISANAKYFHRKLTFVFEDKSTVLIESALTVNRIISEWGGWCVEPTNNCTFASIQIKYHL